MRILGKDNGKWQVELDGEIKHLTDDELAELKAEKPKAKPKAEGK